MKPSTDPLVRATRKAYRASCVGQLDALLAQERRWKSKETLASNKLKKVRRQITEFAAGLAKERDALSTIQNLTKECGSRCA